MTLWLLIVTVHFTFLDRGMTLDLPPETVFRSAEKCNDAGKLEEAMLTQDGTRVEWKCVEIGQ